MKSLGALIAIGLTAALWLVFAPAQLGGRVSYVVIAGASMEPALRSGDLAIVRRAPTYRAGDVVTYRHPELGMVIHRIVEVDGKRFVLQGDTNAWTDSHQPDRSEIVGKLWLHLPGAGRYLEHARSPATLALLSIVIGLTIMLPGRKDPTTSKPRRGTSGPPPMDQRGRDLLALLAVLAIGALVVAGLAFTRPTEQQTVRETAYEHRGVFGYSAPAPAGIYDAPEVTAGEPIFRAVIDSFDVQFDYTLHSTAPVTAAGTASLQAEIRGQNGWTRSFGLQPATEFSEPSTTVSGTVDLAEIQAIIDRVEAETGIEARQYTLTIQPLITVNAAVAGRSLRDSFEPQIAFQLDAQQLQLVTGSTDLNATLRPASGDAVAETAIATNTLDLPFAEIEVAAARRWSLAALGLILLAAGGLVARTLRAGRGDEVDRIAALYGSRLIAVRSSTAGHEGGVDVSTMRDFQRLIEHHEGPVFRDGAAYFIDFEGERYRYSLDGAAPAANDPRPTNAAPTPARAPAPEPARVRPTRRRQSMISQLLFGRKRKIRQA